MIPTNSLLRFTTGLPELPPMMSGVETKLNGVLSSLSTAFFASHDFGRSKGGWLLCSAEWAKAPPTVVAQGEGGVGVGLAAAGLEDGVGDLGVGLRERLVDVPLVLLAQLARAGVDDAGHLDHRIFRGVDGGLAALAEGL